MNPEIELLQQINTPESKQEWEKPRLEMLAVNGQTLGLLGFGPDLGSSHS